MKIKSLVSFIIFIIILGCESKKSEDNSWLKNGTLHKPTVAEWKQASDENKMATCADFVVSLKESDAEKFKTINDIKVSALEMKNCLDEAVIGGSITDDMKINEIAVLCHINLKSFH